ncbi:uncharacterized protein LOC105162996 [Sesamum indicum]|uniref:Uncharacterized protein LOC105162996 n=1 Tax=Sesamum indicum TaxID=4182 RepID=A0A6I9T629_SESIN|nr:uncharacterized protein LOC105162996 [Sesamum indicum]
MAFRATLVFITLLSVATSMSSAAIINAGILGGVLTCTNTSIAIVGTYPVISHARVNLVCGSGSLAQVVRSVVTDTAGLYNFLFTTLDTVLADPGSCYLTAAIPSGSCFFSLPSGVLRIPVVVLGTIDALVGQLLVLAPGPMSFVVPA